LLSGEKILLHLEQFSRFGSEGEAPFSLTQNGIADRIGLQRSHVPRSIKGLVSGGLVRERLSHIKGGGRSRQIYLLTWEGSQAAASLRARTGEVRVDVMMGMTKRFVKLKDVPELLGVRAGILDVVIGAEKGPLTGEELKGRVRREGLVECLGMAPSPRPFFGRERELDLLASWLGGGARLITILGPSGIGKTSTALRLMRRFKGTYHLLWLPLEDWDSLPTLLRPLAAFLAETGRRRLSAFLEGAGTPDPATVHELLQADFQDLAALIVIDDLQKAAEDVAEGIRLITEAALGASAGPRIMILSRERRQLCAPRSWSGSGVHELVLKGLDSASAARLVGRQLHPAERERILSAAGGHPLYIEVLSRRGPAEGMGVVWEHIRSQICEGLGRGERVILAAASVYRHPVAASALLSKTGTAAALDRLVDRSLLLRTGAGDIVMHDLPRDFFYQRLSPTERALLHRRAAEHILSLGDAFGSGPACERLLEALRHLVMAGQKARAASMSAKIGAGLFEAGLGAPLQKEVLDRLTPADAGPDWNALAILRAKILSSRGEWDSALVDYRAVAGMGGPLSAEAFLGVGQILEERSDWEGAASAYSEAARMSPATRPAALRGAARLAWRRGIWGEASAKFAQALRLARRFGHPKLAASILADMGNISSDRGSPVKALQLYEMASRIMEKENALFELARVHNNIGAVLFYEDRWDDSMERYQKCLEISERCGDVSMSAYALSNIGQILARKGEEKRALRYLDASTKTFERLGDDFMLSSNLLARGILYRVLGARKRSEEFFRQGIELLERLDMPRELAEARFEHGLALRDLGDLRMARKELDFAQTRFKMLGAKKELLRAGRELQAIENSKSPRKTTTRSPRTR
jgi:tetratricopeptide (TPR) repeat protein/DNA-binding MarR family transcriptional regulator